MVKSNKPATVVDDAFLQLVQALGSEYEAVITDVIKGLPHIKDSADRSSALRFSGQAATGSANDQLKVAMGCLTALTNLALTTDNPVLGGTAIAARDKLLEVMSAPSAPKTRRR
ncbi:MAG: hypothetical protein EBR02_05790 [Alphaproteobacteria bacterium]|nr:hypothetical protein [Alphaproteobacteria bacterium]